MEGGCIMKIGELIPNKTNTQGMDATSKTLNEKIETVSETQAVDLNSVQVINKAQKNEKDDTALDEEILRKSVDQANRSLEQYNRKIERSVHEVTHNVIYTMRDTETDEVIKEFPPRAIQDMIAKMWELAGLFVDERA